MAVRLELRQTLPILQAALKEDIGTRDLTTAALIHPEATAQAEIVARGDGVVAGVPLIEWAFGLLDKGIRVKPMVKDGDAVHPGKVLAFLEGPARPILSGERTVLNFLSRLSGIATLTRAFVERVAPYPAKILDTRKTTPTLRSLEKYAVAVGGGHNHRMGLYDQVLIKENHLQILATQRGPKTPHTTVIPEALKRCQTQYRGQSPSGTVPKIVRGVKIEIEVCDLEEFRAAIEAGATLILLDNMSVEQIRDAVRMRRRLPQKVWLEASGGVTLETVARVAATGVDYISIGALTRDAPGLDMALEVV